MSSREDILKAVKANQPEPLPLPELPVFARPEGSLSELFQQTAEGVGASVITLENAQGLAAELKKRYPTAQTIAHQLPALDLPSLDWATLTDPHQLNEVDLAILQGVFGVGENAAIWIPETILPQRVLPFITQHLVLLLPQSEIVWNMHEAYARLGTDVPGFGMFLSGPSKTADIEQSLVLGAHGARSLLVVLI